LQWEYQVGPSVGIEAGDHIWASRYILEVISFNLLLVFHIYNIQLFNREVKLLKQSVINKCHSYSTNNVFFKAFVSSN